MWQRIAIISFEMMQEHTNKSLKYATCTCGRARAAAGRGRRGGATQALLGQAPAPQQLNGALYR